MPSFWRRNREKNEISCGAGQVLGMIRCCLALAESGQVSNAPYCNPDPREERRDECEGES